MAIDSRKRNKGVFSVFIIWPMAIYDDMVFAEQGKMTDWPSMIGMWILYYIYIAIMFSLWYWLIAGIILAIKSKISEE